MKLTICVHIVERKNRSYSSLAWEVQALTRETKTRLLEHQRKPDQMKLQQMTNLLAMAVTLALSSAGRAADVTLAEARAIAKEAYIYGYPLVDSYRIQYAYFVDKSDKSFKAPWNHLKNIPNVYTPADTAIQTPNSDTPYSWAGLDLRTNRS